MYQFHVLWVFLMMCVVNVQAGSAVASPVRLTPEEQAWLTAHPTIRISGPRAFPPFHYIDDEGLFKGMAADYISLLANMVGLNIGYTSGMPWPEVLEKIESRELDVLACAAKSAEREHYLSYTNPHLSFPLVIISRKDAPFISGLKSLHKKRIALTKGIVTLDWLHKDGIDFTPHFTRSMPEALEQVSLGRADAAIQNLAAATYIIEKQGLTNLKVAAPTPYGNYDLSIAIRKDWPELTAIFNKALAALDQDQHDAIRQKWIAVRYEFGVRFVDILFWILVTLCVAGLLLGIFYRWNRKLEQEIQDRKMAEQEKELLIHDLRKALDEIETLQGILPLCSFCKKIRDDDGYWEQVDVYIHKHSRADISHSICPDCAREHYPDLVPSAVRPSKGRRQ